jgi:hypothetical protein
MTLDEILANTKAGDAYKIQLNDVHSAEFLKRFPEFVDHAICYYCVIGQGYRTFWGTHVQLAGFEPVPGRVYSDV